MDDEDFYWFDQRMEDAYFDTHGHFLGTEDIDCSLCGPTVPS